MKTGWSCFRFAKIIYVMPVLFGYTHILLTGTPAQNLGAIVSATVGTVLFSIMSTGFFYVRMRLVEWFLLAAATNQIDVVRLALSHGADLNSTDRYDGTALIAASQHGNVEIVKLLISAGVPVDRVNQLGWTALLEAIILGDGSSRYEDIVQALLDAGADANLADREGVTPSRHARERGYKTMVRMLMRARGH